MIKGFNTFPKGICPKVNLIARLEYELAYYDSAVHRFNHYTTRTPQPEDVGIKALLRLHIHSFVLFLIFLAHSFYVIYSYLTEIICKLISLTYRGDSNNYYDLL